MSNDVRTLVVRLKAVAGNYSTTMRKASGDTATFDKESAKAQARADKWRAVGMAAQVGGAALAAGLLATAKAASDQEQALGSLQAVFKTSGAQMEDQARKATELGLSTTAYSNAAAKLGAQLGNLGVSQSDLAGVTTDLMGKSADLAAMFGGTTQEAVDALGAAMRGEADPAENYALALNATAVQAEMTATGATKAEAIMALLNKQMAKSGAAGAAAREYDSAAASTARMRSQFDNATASLGEALLPALSSAANVAAGVVGKFNQLPEPLRTAATYMAAFGAAALIAGPKIKGAVEVTSSLITKLRELEVASKAATAAPSVAATGGWVAALGLAVAAVDQLNAKVAESTGVNQRWLDAFTNVVRGGISPTTFAVSGLQEGIRQLGITMGILPESTGAASDDLQAFTARINAGEGDARTFSDAVNSGASAADAFAAAQKAAGTATGDASAASAADTEAKEQQAQALKQLTADYEAYISAIQGAIDLMSARDALIGQEDRLAAAAEKNGAALRGQTKAAAANRAAIAGEVSTITDYVQAKYDETGSLAAAEKVRRRGIATLLRAAAAAGYDADQTRDLVRRLDAIKPINTSVTVSGLSSATQQANDLAAALRRITGNIGNPGSFGRNLWGHASGGYISGPGGPTDDKIPAMLSNGEFVLRASAVRRIGVGRLNAMNYAAGGYVGENTGVMAFAGGGKVPGPKRVSRDAEKALDKWRKQVAASRSLVAALFKQAVDYRKSIRDNVLGSLRMMDAFDFSRHATAVTANASAQSRLADATQAVVDAQRAFNTAAPGDRVAAARALADAERDLADARTDVAAAQKEERDSAPTPANILKSIQAQAKAAQDYTKKVLGLQKRGLSRELIDQIAGTDPAAAQDMLDALGKMSDKELAAVNAAEKAKKAAADKLADTLTKQRYVKPIRAAQKNAEKVERQRPESVKMALAQRALLTRTQRLTDANERNGKSLDANTRRGRANRKALADEAKLILTVAAETYKRVAATKGTEAAQKAANKVIDQQRTALTQAAGAAGFSKSEVRGYIDTLGLLPRDASTNFATAGLADATLGVSQLQTLILDVPTSRETSFATTGTDSAKSDAQSVKDKYDTIPSSKSTTLAASRASDLGSTVDSTLGYLDDNYGGKTKRAGLGAARASDIGANVGDALGFLDDNYGSRKKNAGLGAAPDGLWPAVTGALGFLDDNYGSKERKAGLNATGRGLGEAVGGAFDYLDREYTSKEKKAGLNAVGRGLGAAVGGAFTYLEGAYAKKEKKTGLNAVGRGLGDAVKGAFGFIDTKYTGRQRNAKLGATKDGASVGAAIGAIIAQAQDYANKHPVKLKTFGLGGAVDPRGATGGLITGPGTGTSDSIPARLSNGEYVIRAASVKKYGVGMFDALNSGSGGVSSLTAAATSPAASATQVNVTITAAPVPVIIKLDNRTVGTGQLKLRRQSGGTLTLGG